MEDVDLIASRLVNEVQFGTADSAKRLLLDLRPMMLAAVVARTMHFLSHNEKHMALFVSWTHNMALAEG